MRKISALIAAVPLVVVCLVTAQNEPEKKPQTWEEKAAERFKDNPTADHKAVIDENLPERTADPAKPRKVLVFYRCEGFIHTSIPFGNYAMEALAEATDAFSVDLTDQYDVFTKENLAKYDGIVFNNTTNLNPSEPQRAAIIDFIESGKGIIGFHAAADNFKGWDEGIAMIGGVFDGHPWTAGG
ncbi:MAG: ThuA domain-containing protein, partial [Verrucomicrobiota bacterium]